MADFARPAALNAADVAVWNDEADFVVVGMGMAGACAAIEARAKGVDVLVLERGSGVSGTTTNAAGHFYLGGGTPVQVACGFEDTAPRHVRLLGRRHARPGAGEDQALLRRKRRSLPLARGARRAVRPVLLPL